MKSYRYLHLDVFSERRFAGNQLAVFPDGRGLTSAAMQAIANEMNFAETTFILPAERPDTDVRMRIFTPAAEMPMAGHPTIGSTFALARTGLIAPGRDRFVFGLNLGPVAVALTWAREAEISGSLEGSGGLTFAWMTQLNPTFSDPIGEPAAAAAILGLAEAAVTATGLPVQIVSCGMPCLLVPLATRRAVDDARLDERAWRDYHEQWAPSANCLFLFSPEPGDDEATVYSRMFAPDLGISEDPATGVASGPLGCYLVKHRVVPPARAARMLSLQGVKMGRPSRIHISIESEGGEISKVHVGGQAVLVAEGVLYVT